MTGVNHTEEQFLQKITEIIDANLHNEQFGVNELAHAMGMSRITLHRKLTQAANISVSQFISQVRLKKAFELLKQNSVTIAEVAYQCGFNSATYFTKSFHDFYGYPPGEAKHHVTPVKPETEIPEVQQITKKRWVQVVFAVAIALIVILISSEVFFFRPFVKEKESAENTIAILPFVNDSGDEFAPFTTWMGIEIGNKLGKIENILVVPQSTTETYRDSKKSNCDIARELMVDHILRGRTIKTGDKILLNVELLEAKSGHPLFTEIYERDLDETEEASLNRIFEICSDVVFQISDALQTDLTPDEKEEVAKFNTENMAALRAYQEANHHLELSVLNTFTNYQLAIEEHMKAKKLFEEAIKIDSTFADAYRQLGHIHLNILPFWADIYLADKYLDTAKMYLDKAYKFDRNNNTPPGYLRKYYIKKGMLEEADKLLPVIKKRVKNCNYYEGRLPEYWDLNDRYQVAEAYLNYMETKPPDIPTRNYMTDRAFLNYLYMGFPLRAREINDENWKLERDTFAYLKRKSIWEIYYGSKDSVLTLCYKLHKKNPSFLYHLSFGVQYYNDKGEHDKALNTLQKLEEKELLVADSISPEYYTYGYTYLKNGMKEKADYHFKGSIKRAEDEIKLNSANARTYDSHFNLARIYAILNDKQKSLQYLGMIKESRSVPLNFINDLKTNPMFYNVRQEPEFQKITRELEKKYLEEHEKIKKLLIRKGLEPA